MISFSFKYILLIILFVNNNGITQTLWQKYPQNPVLGNGAQGFWDDSGVYAPSVVFVNTVYKMFYAGYNGFNYQVGLATSTDKLNWTRHFSLPVLEYGSPGSWDARYVTQPSVLFINGIYKMWYTGSAADLLPFFKIGYAISSNGTNWDKYDFNPVLSASTIGNWDPEGISSPSVIYKDGIYYMWFTGHKNISSAIGLATSSNGINWDWYQGNPVLEGDINSWDKNVANCEVLEIGGNFLMWFSGKDGSTSRIGFANSEDGVNWEKYQGNPVLENGPGFWEQFSVDEPDILYIEGEYLYMWYSGFDNPNHSQIGFANQLTIGVEQEGFLLNEFNLFQNYPNPFNPNTVISYQLPVISNVTLKVYDLLGREIVTLVNEEKPAGTYEVEFNNHSGLSGIRDLPSGIYFYQLLVSAGRSPDGKAGSFVQTKKMLMIK